MGKSYDAAVIGFINKGSVPYCGSNDNNSTGVSLSEILFSFMLEQGKSEGFDSCDQPSNLTQNRFKSSIFQPV